MLTCTGHRAHLARHEVLEGQRLLEPPLQRHTGPRRRRVDLRIRVRVRIKIRIRVRLRVRVMGRVKVVMRRPCDTVRCWVWIGWMATIQASAMVLRGVC